MSEWFGGDPGHEALTAYGLMQFVDMAQVRQVDPDMVKRTRQWLLDKRDGKGGFKRNDRALDSFGRAPEATTAAYIVWSLLEAGEKGLEKEIEAVEASAATSKDSYVIALGANVASLAGHKDTARKLLDMLAKKQNASGAIDGAVTSITCSGGEALQIEATALAVLAFMRSPDHAAQVENGIKWICEACKSGRFGSTQSTILALRAIVNYDKSRARPKNPGTITLAVDGKQVGQVNFTPDQQGAIELPDIAALMTPGEHKLELSMAKGSSMPFAMTVKYHNTQPASSNECKVGLETTLREALVEEGNVTEVNVVVTNRAKEAISTPVAIVGLPAGLEVRHDQLKELVKSGKIDAYEVLGREVVLYWRGLKPEAKVQLPISCVAAIPGTYTAPAGRAYLYYTDEHKTWTPGLKLTISAK